MNWQLCDRRGYASVLAMLLLVLGTTLAVGFCGMMLNGRYLAANHRSIQEASKAAESGTQFLVLKIVKVSPSAGLRTHTSSSWMQPLAAQLTAELTSTGNLPAGSQLVVAPDNSSIGFPAIKLPDSTTFTAVLTPSPTNGQHLQLAVTGHSIDGKVSRTIAFDLDSEPERVVSATRFPIAARNGVSFGGASGAYGYDPASGSNDGQVGEVIAIGSNNNDPAEAVVLTQPGQPLPDYSSFVTMVFPQTDTGFLDAGHTSMLARYSAANPNGMITNTYIPAGTNPSFNSDVELRGIIYVEWPNNITFSGNTKINGVIVYAAATTQGGKKSGSTITLGKNANVTNSRDQSNSNLNAIAWLSDEQRKTLSSWAIIAPQTDLALNNGNGASKSFENSIHVNNLTGAGSGNTGPSLIMNQASIVAEDQVSITGNRVFWVASPADSPEGTNYQVNRLYVMQESYKEQL